MNNASLAIPFAYKSSSRAPANATRRCRPAMYVVPSGTRAARSLQPRNGLRVAEDRDLYIANLLPDRTGDKHLTPERQKQIGELLQQIRDLDCLLANIWNLTRMMINAFGHVGDARDEETVSGLTMLEEKVRGAYNDVDRHESSFMRFATAYIELEQELKRAEQAKLDADTEAHPGAKKEPTAKKKTAVRKKRAAKKKARPKA